MYIYVNVRCSCSFLRCDSVVVVIVDVVDPLFVVAPIESGFYVLIPCFVVQF